ncbi:MAG: hypothetical protein OHK0031_13720 [Anaerolineales bacterium]
MVLRSIEVTIERDGTIKLPAKIKLSGVRRAILTILNDPLPAAEAALLSETALSEDWNRSEEDQAWKHLQSAR